MVLVRNYSNADEKDVLSLGCKIFREKDEIPLLKKAVNQCVPNLSFVAIDNKNEIIGFTIVCKKMTCCYSNFMDKIPNCYELAFIGISPKSQGQGLGSRLLKETLIAIFQTSAQFTCWLLVDTINTGAIHLYEKFGFRRWLETKSTFIPCYVMGLSYRRYVKKDEALNSKYQMCTHKPEKIK
jgi:ribosomal protein S18 acetylase RimI-like enzyme